MGENGACSATLERLSVAAIDTVAGSLADLCDRNMALQCNIQDDAVYLSSETGEVELALRFFKDARSNAS